MSAPSLRRQLLLWLLLPLLGLLALDAWLTYSRAMAAAHQAFDRTLQASLKTMREGIRLRDGQFAIDLPYLALDIFESEAGSSIFYRILDARGKTLTGYDELPLCRPPGHPSPTARRSTMPRCAACRSAWRRSGCRCAMPPRRRSRWCGCWWANRSSRAKRWRTTC